MDCVVPLSSASYERLLALCVLSESKYPKWLPIVNSYSYWGRERVCEERRFLRLFLSPSFMVTFWKTGKLGWERERRGTGSSYRHCWCLMLWASGLGLALVRYNTLHSNAQQSSHCAILPPDQPSPKAPDTKVSLEPKSLHFLATLTAQHPIVIGITINLHRTAQGKILI